jgi:hypothetical protein
MKPVRTATAFAITVGLFYSLCTLVWVAAPGSFLRFMNGLFHGMDFTPLVQPGPFSIPSFVLALAVLSAWAWLAAAFFAWFSNRFSR